MRVVKVNENGADCAKGSAELNQHVEDGKKEEVRDGVAGEGQGLSVEDEMRIVEAVKVNDMKETRRGDSDHPQVEIHRPQPQPQLHVVRWDKFLPVRSLKVLLVEYDDSTRHVVSALLRNCSYEVTAVSNGLEAWRILEDLNNQIDLVLTEVVMPGVSGIGLLSKIMSHKSRQNIPVIMMSSHDSMGMVLKCLSKGAVDFLVKPIRKNELKTLWQHVWRKCHSSSGSGSESGIRTEKSIQGKSVEESDNGSGSNDDDTRSIGLQNRDGSDDGSGTQSSWTKRAAEAESPQPMSSWDQLADLPDSTCALVIYSRREAFASSWVSAPMKDHRGPDNQLDDVSLGKDLEIGMPRNLDTHLKEPSKKVTTITSTEKNQPSPSDLNNDGQKFDKGKLEISNEKPKEDLTKQTKKLPGGIVINDGHHRGSGSKTPAALPEIAKSKDKVLGNMKDLPSLDLSLKRLGEDAHTKTNAPEQNILRHSELSAFTRYNTGSTANQGQTGNVGSCSPVDDSSEAVKQSHSDTPPNQNSNSSSNNNDMGSTTYGSFTKPAAATDKVPAKSKNIKSSRNSSVFQPAQTDDASNPQLLVSVNNKACAGIVNVVPLQENDMHQPVQIHHHHHHHHHHVYSVQSLEQVPKHEDLSLKNMDETTPQCGSSDAGRVAVEANVATNGSLNGSACGSNHESNMLNGSSAAVNAEGMTIGKDNGVTIKDGDDGSGTGSGVGVDHRSAQREAALNKFRQKRKERCFEKRVRYQSRKKLAEQRPRVRGQFVRHARETKGKEGDSQFVRHARETKGKEGDS